MRAITIEPGVPDSIRLDNIEKPQPLAQELLVRTLALGVCGTDHELISGAYGWAPPQRKRLVIGHESLGRVDYAPPGSNFEKNDLVVGIVRRPDPLPCECCAVGEWDMCRNGQYTEHGIKQRDGFGAEWFTLPLDAAVKIDASLYRTGVLLEPTSVVAKAWEQIERISKRARWQPRTVLITGAGPIGLLAALLATQRNLDVHVIDVVREGIKSELVKQLNATYHSEGIAALNWQPDIVIECSGVPEVIIAAVNNVAPCGIVCLAGVSSGGHKLELDIGLFNRSMVLENEALFGSVNANRRHYEAAASALARADQDWLERIITRRVPLAQWADAFQRRNDDVKTIIEFSE